MRRGGVVSCCVILMLGAPEAVAADTRVDLVNISGSGCAEETLLMTVKGDEIVLTYTDFIIESGPDADLPARANCRVTLDVQPKPGYAFAWSRAETMGTAELAEGAEGTFTPAAPYFLDQPQAEVDRHRIGGTPWRISAPLDPDRLTWSGCGQHRPFAVSPMAELGEARGEDTDYLAVQRGEITLTWKTCA